MFPVAVGMKGDASTVGRPAREAVFVNVVCELLQSCSIGLDDEDVFLLAGFIEYQPFVVRREPGVPRLPRALGNPLWLRDDILLDGIEARLLNVRSSHLLHVGD